MISHSKFYREIRRFAVRTQVWMPAIRYEIKEDEKDDLSLIARRVYGSSSEAITIMAAAGLDRINQSLIAGMTLVLPTVSQLQSIKAANGFNNVTLKSLRRR